MTQKPQQTGHNLRKTPTRKIKLEPNHQIEIDKSITAAQDVATPKGLEYFHRDSRQYEFFTEKEIEHMGSKVIQWALDNPRANKLMRFFWPLHIGEDTVTSLCKRFPRFKEDCDIARELIGGNLWEGALLPERNMREGTALRYLPSYDKEYRKETERIAKQRLEIAAAEPPKQIVALIPRFVDKFDEKGKNGTGEQSKNGTDAV